MNTTTEIWAEAESIAREAWDEYADTDDLEDRQQLADEYLWESINGNQDVIYTSNAWDLVHTARQDSGLIDPADEFIDDIGGFPPNESIDGHMTRYAFAVLYCAAQSALQDLRDEAEEE